MSKPYKPVFLTKNGYADIAVMSSDAYEKMQFESDVYFKLREVELEARTTNQRYSHNEVMSGLRNQFAARGADKKVLGFAFSTAHIGFARYPIRQRWILSAPHFFCQTRVRATIPTGIVRPL